MQWLSPSSVLQLIVGFVMIGISALRITCTSTVRVCDNPLARADYGTTKVVTQDVGTLDANQETSFHLSGVFVKGRMPCIFASGYPCR